MSLILADAERAPQLFRWNGAVDRQKLAGWIGTRDWRIPPDLFEFWALTGGGQVFESETFHRPVASADQEGGVDRITNWCRRLGMAAALVVFHEGLGLTAISVNDGAYFSLTSDLRVQNQYGSFDHWYRDVLRAAYRTRYGLPPRQPR